MDLIERLQKALAVVGGWEAHPALDYSIFAGGNVYIDIVAQNGGAGADAKYRDAVVAMCALLREAAAALEAAREDATPPVTSPATSPVRILIDVIESEIRQLEGKSNWMSQAARIASLRAAIDQARGKGVAE